MLFRRLAFLTLLVTSGAAFGQVRIAQEGQGVSHVNHYANHDVTFNVSVGQPSEESIPRVRSALNLSEAQTNALQTLMKMRLQAIEQITGSADEAHRKLEELIKQPNSNPTELGMALLAVRSIHEGVEAAQDKFRTDFRGLLSAEQRSTLDKLKTASDQVDALEQAGILESEHPRAFTMPVLSGIEPFAIGIHGPLSNNR